MRETVDKTIDLLEELRSELWQQSYRSWYNRDTMFSWEESTEYKDYTEWEKKIYKQISELDGSDA
jgi:hypothetical protein